MAEDTANKDNTNVEDVEVNEDTQNSGEEAGNTLVTETNNVEATSGEQENNDSANEEDSNSDDSKTDDAPIEYEAFKVPEGFEVNEDVQKDLIDFAHEKRLSQEEAQKLADMNTKAAQDAVNEMYGKWEGIQKDWRNAAKADKEYGGEDFDKNLGLAKRALKEYGTPELAEAVELTGMGNHPELVRFLVRVGKTLSEDNVMNEGGAITSTEQLAKRLFPNQN